MQQEKQEDNMARKVFFSFHYEDVANFRVNIVRMSNRFQKNKGLFIDASIWEEVAETRTLTIKNLINTALKQTSVTCVLIGSNTFSRRFVRYEIASSFANKKGLIGVGINWIRDKDNKIIFLPGNNPFAYLGFRISRDRKWISLFELKDDQWCTYRDLPKIKYSHKYLDSLQAEIIHKMTSISKRYSYDWDDGYKYLPQWTENAAQNVGR